MNKDLIAAGCLAALLALTLLLVMQGCASPAPDRPHFKEYAVDGPSMTARGQTEIDDFDLRNCVWETKKKTDKFCYLILEDDYLMLKNYIVELEAIVKDGKGF